MKYLVSRLRAAFATPVRAATAREPYTLPTFWILHAR
jgi:hypothetical protein